MRQVSKAEKKKRGCEWCLDTKRVRASDISEVSDPSDKRKILCIHESCPYHELDKVRDYESYDRYITKKWKKAMRGLV